MKKLTGTRIGISVNKSSADKKFQVRDTVFKKGSLLNNKVHFYSSQDQTIGYSSHK
jgi:hypothetical protein